MEPSLQDKFAPRNRCFGCGPSNAQGLRLKSHVSADWASSGEVTCDWTPAPQYEAFTGMLNGGIIGALLDCHSNWTAAHHLMRQSGASEPPCTVTADFHVKLRKPTASGAPVHLSARVVESGPDRATVEASLSSGGVVTATCRGLFVAVKEGHPAFHRW
jgi:acyl-coenzyme A thioesterase PaaI-like protein